MAKQPSGRPGTANQKGKPHCETSTHPGNTHRLRFSDAGYHYLGCAKTFALMGQAFAEANLKMLASQRP